MTICDEILLKYADGQLDTDAAAKVAQGLVHDADALQRLHAIRLSGVGLAREAARSAALSENDPLAQMILQGHSGTELREGRSRTQVAPSKRSPAFSTTRQRRTWPAAMRIAASIALLAIGLVSGYLAQGWRNAQTASGLQAYPTWLIRVVDYHTLYRRETVAPARRITRSDIAALAARFSATLAQRVVIPDLAAERLEFRRGQVLKFNNDPIIQLAYLPNKSGHPIALCLKTTTSPDALPSFEILRGLGTIRWRQNGIDYVLVGDHSETFLRAAAGDARQQIALGGRS